MIELKNKIYTLIIIIFSLLCGIISEDYFLGTIILMCGLLNSYYASIGKIYNYIFGALYSLLSAYVCYKNGLYGMTILSLVIYFPSQVQGFICWKKNMGNNEVKIRGFNTRNSIIITLSCAIGSIILGFLLSKIPGQRLAFLDSSSNIINLCGIILMNLRFRECWFVWLFNNSIDIFIWLINFINKGSNSLMMLLVSVGYLLINIYGLYKWIKYSKR